MLVRLIILLGLYCAVLVVFGATEKIRFLSMKHPNVSYFNTKYVSYMNLTSHRFSRYDPRYYVSFHFYSIWTFHNNVTLDFYFYEFLSNTYRRGFVEMHFKLCDLINKDLFFGTSVKQGQFGRPCPYPPGDYHLYNLTVPINQIPENFPFTKGRIFCNMTSRVNRDLIASVYLDMEIKTTNLGKKNNFNATKLTNQNHRVSIEGRSF